jgi:hypothetical protein
MPSHDAADGAGHEIQQLLELLNSGCVSMPKAAEMLRWDLGRMQMEMWGKVRL